jgi:hypothetical protein
MTVLVLVLALGVGFLAGLTLSAARLRRQMDQLNSEAREIEKNLRAVSAALAETQQQMAALSSGVPNGQAPLAQAPGAAPTEAPEPGARGAGPEPARVQPREAEPRRAGTGGAQMQQPQPEPPGPRPLSELTATLRTGQELLLSAAHDEYPLAMDEEAYGDFLALAAQRDRLGMAELAGRGRLVTLTPGTRVMIVQLVGGADPRAKVKVLSGPEEGETGWIQRAFLGN